MRIFIKLNIKSENTNPELFANFYNLLGKKAITAVPVSLGTYEQQKLRDTRANAKVNTTLKAMMPQGYESQIFFVPTTNTEKQDQIIPLTNSDISKAFEQIEIVWKQELCVPFVTNEHSESVPMFTNSNYPVSEIQKQNLIQNYDNLINKADVVIPLELTNNPLQPIDFRATVNNILHFADMINHPNLPTLSTIGNEADYMCAIYKFFFDEETIRKHREISSQFLATKTQFQIVCDYYQRLFPKQNLITSNVTTIFSTTKLKFNELPLSHNIKFLSAETNNVQQSAINIFQHLQNIIPKLVSEQLFFKNFLKSATNTGSVSFGIYASPHGEIKFIIYFTNSDYANRFYNTLNSYNFISVYNIQYSAIELDLKDLPRFLTVICGLNYSHVKIIFNHLDLIDAQHRINTQTISKRFGTELLSTNLFQPIMVTVLKIIGTEKNDNELRFNLDMSDTIKNDHAQLQVHMENFSFYLQAALGNRFTVHYDTKSIQIVVSSSYVITDKDLNFIAMQLVNCDLLYRNKENPELSYDKIKLLNDLKEPSSLLQNNNNNQSSQINNDNRIEKQISQLFPVSPAQSQKTETAPSSLQGRWLEIQKFVSHDSDYLQHLTIRRRSLWSNPTILHLEKNPNQHGIKLAVDSHGQNLNLGKYIQDQFKQNQLEIKLEVNAERYYLVISSNKNTYTSLDETDVFQICDLLNQALFRFDKNYDENAFFESVEQINQIPPEEIKPIQSQSLQDIYSSWKSEWNQKGKSKKLAENPHSMFNLNPHQQRKLEEQQKQTEQVLKNAYIDINENSDYPLEFICPLSLELMIDPVRIKVKNIKDEQQNYLCAERDAIVNMIEHTGKHPFNPDINLQNAKNLNGYEYELVPDLQLKQKIDKYNETKAAQTPKIKKSQ